MTVEREKALSLWEEGTVRLMIGEVEEAIRLFTRSLELSPTAEAYTFRGWALSFTGRLDEAIEECRKAIATDPGFGNPYNDIGCYLMQKGELDQAVPWFEQAKKATRYEPRHFPYLNLGRLHAARGDVSQAVLEFEGALKENPNDPIAVRFLEQLRYRVN
ncbi:MAG TPA: tetratricopeptide repeat protein [Thermoanaerobaculia bacterium]|nr:tetratricopeptide repeat protein [Thermoanaerobaculia bacterium]